MRHRLSHIAAFALIAVAACAHPVPAMAESHGPPVVTNAPSVAGTPSIAHVAPLTSAGTITTGATMDNRFETPHTAGSAMQSMKMAESRYAEQSTRGQDRDVAPALTHAENVSARVLDLSEILHSKSVELAGRLIGNTCPAPPTATNGNTPAPPSFADRMTERGNRSENALSLAIENLNLVLQALG